MCHFAPAISNTFRWGPKVTHCLNLHGLFLQKRRQGINRFLPGVTFSAEGNAIDCSGLQCVHQPVGCSRREIMVNCSEYRNGHVRAERTAGEDVWNTHEYYQKIWSFLPLLANKEHCLTSLVWIIIFYVLLNNNNDNNKLLYLALLLMEITWVPQKHQSNQQSDLSQGSILPFQRSKSQGKHQDFK